MAGDKKATLPKASRRAIGRPRRLTLDAIVDAACEIGIANLEMGVLADHLNTGVATLYGYVRGRDHLLQLVTQRLAGQALVNDRGQNWQDILREHAAISHMLFRTMPQLIANLMTDDMNREGARYSRLILDMLGTRGIPLPLGVDMYVETNQVVIGAAISLMRRERLAAIAVEETGARVPMPDMLGDYRPTLERIIQGYEALLPQQREQASPVLD